jgi:hypothetical protein
MLAQILLPDTTVKLVTGTTDSTKYRNQAVKENTLASKETWLAVASIAATTLIVFLLYNLRSRGQ